MDEKKAPSAVELNLRRALQEIATGEIVGEPENKADAYWLVRAVAQKALEENP